MTVVQFLWSRYNGLIRTPRLQFTSQVVMQSQFQRSEQVNSIKQNTGLSKRQNRLFLCPVNSNRIRYAFGTHFCCIC